MAGRRRIKNRFLNKPGFIGIIKNFWIYLLIFSFICVPSFAQTGNFQSISDNSSQNYNIKKLSSNNKYPGFQTLSGIYNRIGTIRIDNSMPKYKLLNQSEKSGKNILKVQTASFKVNYTGFTVQAKAAFQYAVDLWAKLITSAIPIAISATMRAMEDPNILGQGGADDHIVNPPNAPVKNTAYALPLAEKYFNNHINHPDSSDINLTFNTNFSWYYGTDGNCPQDKVDFVSVVLHEICHGLGYIPSMLCLQYQGENLGLWGRPRFNHPDQDTWYPFIYDHFIYNSTGEKIVDKYPNSVDTRLYTELQGNLLYWKGPNTGIRKLYCPTKWEQGSSISHLDWSEPVNLMRPGIAFGSVIHIPGEIVLKQFTDMGWSISSSLMNKVSGGEKELSSVVNYPNPFNSNTQIIIDLKERDIISIVMYDLLGRRIKTFFGNEEHDEGVYNLTWDGRDQNSLPVASGTYILNVTGQKINLNKKITILK